MDALEEAKKAIEEVYSFRDNFFLEHALDQAERKESLLQVKQQEAQALLAALDSKESSQRAQWYYTEGKLLNVLASYNSKAEELLAKAVKLDPSIVGAWNQLGECFWKKGQLSEAKNCFQGALQQKRNCESMRCLSMVLRRIEQGTANHMENTKKSLEHAKEAVAMDIKDGQSWMVLGNAYLSMFFLNGQDEELSKKALAAYSNAEKDKKTYYNPDLHYNRAVLYKYLEEYGAALEDFEMAGNLDPLWPAPRESGKGLLQKLKQFQQLIQLKGRLKPKQTTAFLEKLAQFQDTDCLSSALDSGRAEKLHLMVAGQCQTEEQLPMCLVCLDHKGEATGVTLYNVAEGKGPVLGDVLIITKPKIKRICLEKMAIDFVCVSVWNLTTVDVNNKPFPKDHISPTAVSVGS